MLHLKKTKKKTPCDITILHLCAKKLKKTPGDVIALHMCTINQYHMMYAFWDMESDRHNFLTF